MTTPSLTPMLADIDSAGKAYLIDSAGEAYLRLELDPRWEADPGLEIEPR